MLAGGALSSFFCCAFERSLSKPSLGSETTCDGAVFAQHTVGPSSSFRRLLHGLVVQMRVRQQSANSRSAVRSTNRMRSSRSGGALGHMQHIKGNESDTHEQAGSLLQSYTYCNIGVPIQCSPVPYIQVWISRTCDHCELPIGNPHSSQVTPLGAAHAQ